MIDEMRPVLMLVLLGVLAAPGAVPAAVVVTFKEPERYSETGLLRDDGPRAMKELEAHLKRMGELYLPADQTVRIEILDIDLAGEQRLGSQGQEIRVLRGRADFPRIRLRYTWERPGATAQSGEETVSDMTYLQRTVPDMGAFAHEKRMLESWFRQRFAAKQAHAFQ
jgi:hypothetical protein